LWTATPPYAFADPTQPNQNVSPATTTTFVVRGTTGSCYEEDTVVITVRPKPVVNAGPDDTLCVNTPYVLNGSVSAGCRPCPIPVSGHRTEQFNRIDSNGIHQFHTHLLSHRT
jgi:hypothetical protein